MKVRHVSEDANNFEKKLNSVLKELRGDSFLPKEIVKEVQYCSQFSNSAGCIIYSALIIIHE